MKIDLNNRQSRRWFRLRAARALASFLADRALRTLSSRSCTSFCVSVIMVDDRQIRCLKQTCFGRSEITDVIALPYRPVPGSMDTIAGEIFVNLDRVHRVGPGFGGPAHELALYIAHGLDHLAGATDATRRARQRMRRRELRWVAMAAKRGLLRNLFLPDTKHSSDQRQVRRHA